MVTLSEGLSMDEGGKNSVVNLLSVFCLLKHKGDYDFCIGTSVSLEVCFLQSKLRDSVTLPF